MKIYSKIAGLLLVNVLLFSSCNGSFDSLQLSDQYESATEYIPTHTITRFISEFSSTIGDLPTRTPSLFTVDTIPSNVRAVISGVVTSDDSEGNIYKYIVIQDTLTHQALKVSVDAGNLSAIFPVGTIVSINCSGLALGKYAQMIQLGSAFYNTSSGKTGFEVGRIPYTIFMKRVQVTKARSNPLSLIDTLTISQIRSSGAELYGRLVCIKNAKFTGKGANFGVPAAIAFVTDKIFAPSTNGVGFPQSREISDGTGSVFIATSEYSKFATRRLPEPTVIGNITAIVGWYNDKDATLVGSKIYHQLTLRSIHDLGKGYESYLQPGYYSAPIQLLK